MNQQGQSIKWISTQLRSKKLTAEQLLDHSLQQIEQHNATLNAFISVDAEGARVQAQDMDREIASGQYRGPLHGVPVAVKANIDVEGKVVSACSAPFQDRVAQRDAACVDQLRRAGAVIVGITNMHELAYGGTGNVSLHGPARNPHDPSRIAGGSSSGSASAVAAGMVPMALGTDTGGSVRIPASACGIVGYKPSYGFIDKTGVLPLSWTLDHVGPLAHDVISAGLSASVLFADTQRGHALREALDGFKPDTKTLDVNIGVCNVPDMGVDAPVDAAVSNVLEVLTNRGARQQAFNLQYLRPLHVSWLNIMYAEATARYVKEEFCDYRKFSSPVKVQLEAGRSVTGVNYLDAQRFRGFFQDYFGALFDDFDVICLPTLPVVAPQINQEEVQIGDRTVSTQDAMTFTNQLANMLGCPAISIPAGNDAQGLPVGVTFLMPHGRDLELLQFAARVEGLLRGAGITP